MAYNRIQSNNFEVNLPNGFLQKGVPEVNPPACLSQGQRAVTGKFVPSSSTCINYMTNMTI